MCRFVYVSADAEVPYSGNCPSVGCRKGQAVYRETHSQSPLAMQYMTHTVSPLLPCST